MIFSIRAYAMNFLIWIIENKNGHYFDVFKSRICSSNKFKNIAATVFVIQCNAPKKNTKNVLLDSFVSSILFQVIRNIYDIYSDLIWCACFKSLFMCLSIATVAYIHVQLQCAWCPSGLVLQHKIMIIDKWEHQKILLQLFNLNSG